MLIVCHSTQDIMHWNSGQIHYWLLDSFYIEKPLSVYCIAVALQDSKIMEILQVVAAKMYKLEFDLLLF